MASVKGPVTAGVDHNHFERLVVSNTEFPSDATVIILFKTNLMNLSFINEGSNPIEYSFNGNTLHGDLVPSTASASLSFTGRNYNKIWFRAPSGSSTIRVEAWG